MFWRTWISRSLPVDARTKVSGLKWTAPHSPSDAVSPLNPSGCTMRTTTTEDNRAQIRNTLNRLIATNSVQFKSMDFTDTLSPMLSFHLTIVLFNWRYKDIRFDHRQDLSMICFALLSLRLIGLAVRVRTVQTQRRRSLFAIARRRRRWTIDEHWVNDETRPTDWRIYYSENFTENT